MPAAAATLKPAWRNCLPRVSPGRQRITRCKFMAAMASRSNIRSVAYSATRASSRSSRAPLRFKLTSSRGGCWKAEAVDLHPGSTHDPTLDPHHWLLIRHRARVGAGNEEARLAGVRHGTEA